LSIFRFTNAQVLHLIDTPTTISDSSVHLIPGNVKLESIDINMKKMQEQFRIENPNKDQYSSFANVSDIISFILSNIIYPKGLQYDDVSPTVITKLNKHIDEQYKAFNSEINTLKTEFASKLKVIFFLLVNE
jgi:hypothetical protein